MTMNPDRKIDFNLAEKLNIILDEYMDEFNRINLTKLIDGIIKIPTINEAKQFPEHWISSDGVIAEIGLFQNTDDNMVSWGVEHCRLRIIIPKLFIDNNRKFDIINYLKLASENYSELDMKIWGIQTYIDESLGW
ncbi:MAG: hypothetical protein ACOC3V_05605 [bacterium]